MVNPKTMGTLLYKKKICGEDGYDLNYGASVVGVIGGQGSAKTACCLDIAEKKMGFHPKEKIFWHDTIGSPAQYRKAKFFPYRIFVEEGYELKFYDATNNRYMEPDVTYFSDVAELYELAPYQTINAVYFSNKKSWIGYGDGSKTGLLEYLMSNQQQEWQTVIFDEMQALFPKNVNNQTEERWYDWVNEVVAEKIMECRKSRVGVVGNYHRHSSIFHEISNKFMFHIWGLGSIPNATRVRQNCVDTLDPGEFWIDEQGTFFGKIGIITRYEPPSEEWIVQKW